MLRKVMIRSCRRLEVWQRQGSDGGKNGENERCFRKLSCLKKRKNELGFQETLLE